MCVTHLVPGGANGVLLKLKIPNRKAFAERAGLVLEERRRLRVSSAWKSRRSHSPRGKSGGKEARLAKKWCLKVWMARSAAFLR